MKGLHILSIEGGSPRYRASTERPQPSSWAERVLFWFRGWDMPVREEEWVSEYGAMWFRVPDGLEAPFELGDALYTRLESDAVLKAAQGD